MKKNIKAVDAHGRKLGGETPLLCTPLVGRTRERLLAARVAGEVCAHALGEGLHGRGA